MMTPSIMSLNTDVPKCQFCWVSVMLSVCYAQCQSCSVSVMPSVSYAECKLCLMSVMLSVSYAECQLCRVSVMLSVSYVECQLCWVMLSVANKPFILYVIMLTLVMLNTVMLNVVAPEGISRSHWWQPGADGIKYYNNGKWTCYWLLARKKYTNLNKNALAYCGVCSLQIRNGFL